MSRCDFRLFEMKYCPIFYPSRNGEDTIPTAFGRFRSSTGNRSGLMQTG